jgi:hypothetical protein
MPFGLPPGVLTSIIRATTRIVVAVLLTSTLTSPAFANGLADDKREAPGATAATSTAVPTQTIPWIAASVDRAKTDRPERPGLLVPLYVTAGAMQAMDFYTTSRGLKAGAHETNARLRTANAATTIAFKAATTAAGIVIAEKLWRKSKAGAILGMVAANAITTAVVVHNYRVIRQLEAR